MADTAAPAAAPVKENKAQKAERLKREKNAWESWDEVREFARLGRQSVPEEWMMYFRWWGIYTQGDGAGAIGGVGGEGKSTEYFMLRIGIPNGILTAHQASVISDIVRDHARGIVDVTTRQNFQLHWLTIQDLPVVSEKLTAIGLSPKGACGDVARNVTGCPMAGYHPHELVDASPLARRVSKRLTGNPDFVNLPRKFKFSITGCPVWCSYPEINDAALTAVERMNPDGAKEVGYTVRVGGGLSREPHLGVRLNAFVKQDQAEEVCIKIAEIFRDSQILRENRAAARIKYLFMKFGWTAESMLEEIERRLGVKLDPGVEEKIPDEVVRDHTGVIPQKQKGLNTVGVSILNGRLTDAQLRGLAELAKTNGDGNLRCTIQQNMLLMGVPSEKVQETVGEVGGLGLHVEATNFWRGAIACTGTEFCKLAISETKGFSKWLVGELEDRLPEFDQQIRIHVTGCPNSCGQHWIADFGLEGKKIKHEGKMVDAFYFYVGGSVGEYQRFSRAIGYRVPASETPDAMERFLKTYLKQRQPGEHLRAYFGRYSDEELRAQLAGAVLEPAERDLPTGRAPHFAE
ncbi:MAG: nitrite/sulfite reductase [Acidobacteria bacterium]|nr:nitrite/sulfite reductase [Acidobacteriota bacterium]